jgi:hypothetical protein
MDTLQFDLAFKYRHRPPYRRPFSSDSLPLCVLLHIGIYRTANEHYLNLAWGDLLLLHTTKQANDSLDALGVSRASRIKYRTRRRKNMAMFKQPLSSLVIIGPFYLFCGGLMSPFLDINDGFVQK